MLFIFMVLLKLSFAVAFIALINVVAKGMFALSGLLFKVGEAAFDSDSTQNDIVTVRYPLYQENNQNDGSRGKTQRGSSFFEDAGDLDLEYRGVGVAQDRRTASVLGANVSKRGSGKHRSSR